MVIAHLEAIVERNKAHLKNASGSICRMTEEGPIGFDVIDPLIEIIKAQEARIDQLERLFVSRIASQSQ
jgi:hypothetical protein